MSENRGTKLWIILGSLLVLLLVALAGILSYFAFKSSNRIVAETPVSNSNSQTKSLAAGNTNQNANQKVESKTPEVESKVVDDSANLTWLNGVWAGEGYQTDTKTTWRVILTVKDGSYTIEYPNIPCGGTWKLNDQNSRGGSFTEVITNGIQRCANNSRILIEKLNDSEISCTYSHAGSRTVIATAVLSKKFY